MLNESNKERLRNAVSSSPLSNLIELGPVRLVNKVITSRPKEPELQEDWKNVFENRTEAEQYVAGLLGMM